MWIGLERFNEAIVAEGHEISEMLLYLCAGLSNVEAILQAVLLNF